MVISGVVVWPRRRPPDSDRPGFEFGFLSTLLGGGAAGGLLWTLITDQMFVDEGFGVRTAAATILAGLGGGAALTSWVNSKFGTAIDQQADQQANQETGAIAEPQARAIETLTQDLTNCIERERKLREEVERLKKGGA